MIHELSAEQIRACVFTIYDRPEDYPHDVVIRACDIKDQGDPQNPVPLPMVWRVMTLEIARALIAAAKPEATLIPRDPSDAPSIVESWF